MSLLSRYPAASQAARLLLFISHSWRYGDDRTGVHSLLERVWRKNLDFCDLSVPVEHPIHNAEDDAELYDRLRDRIQPCDVLLVLGGMYANQSTWIEREVHIARALRVPIITVVPNGQERIASTATRFATEVVHWRGRSVREAIMRHAPPIKAAEIARRVQAREVAAAEIFLATFPDARPKPPRGPTLLTAGLYNSALGGPEPLTPPGNALLAFRKGLR